MGANLIRFEAETFLKWNRQTPTCKTPSGEKTQSACAMLSDSDRQFANAVGSAGKSKKLCMRLGFMVVYSGAINRG